MRTVLAAIVLAVGALGIASSEAIGQTYPSKPIRLVVAASAASPVDIISR